MHCTIIYIYIYIYIYVCVCVCVCVLNTLGWQTFKKGDILVLIDPWRRDREVAPKRLFQTTIVHCVKSRERRSDVSTNLSILCTCLFLCMFMYVHHWLCKFYVLTVVVLYGWGTWSLSLREDVGWGCLRIGCWGEYLGLRGMRWQGSGENYIT